MNILVLNGAALNMDNMNQISLKDESKLDRDGYNPSTTFKFVLQISFAHDETSTRIPVDVPINGIEEYQRVKFYAEKQFPVDVQKGGLIDLTAKINAAKANELDPVSKNLENINL